MIDPMTKFLKEDIRDFKVNGLSVESNSQNQKRDFGRTQERYEELVSRYASQPKSKEASVLREVGST
jgi:hypothetical protein